MALKPRIAAAVWPVALEAAASGATRAQIGDAIRKRAIQLGAKNLTRADVDNPARRAITASNAAKRAGQTARDIISTLPTARGTSARAAVDQKYHYRVIVTYVNRDSGERVNNAVTVSSREPLSTREAVDVAMNTASNDRGRDINPSGWTRGQRKRVGPEPEPIKGFITAVWRA